MKQSFLALIFILTTALTAMAQATQPCVVKQYNQKQQKTPLAGVQVEVRDAGSAASGSDGRLTLSFRTLKPGDRVPFRAATKAGFELMNKAAVEQWIISRNQQPFEIVLIQSAYFTQLKSNLKQSSVDSYHQKYEQTLAELEKLKKDGKLKEQEYNDKLNELEDRYDSQLRNLDAYIDQFARIDLSELSEQEQQFIELAHAGRLDEAAEAYNSLNAAGKFITAVENVRRLNEGIAKLEDEKAKQQEAADAFFAMLLRQVNTLKLAGGEENYRKAGELLKRAALADTTNLVVVEAYALFAYNQHYFEDSEHYYLICLNSSNDNLYLQTGILNNLGSLYMDMHEYTKAEKCLLKALENHTLLYDQNPDADMANLAITQNDLGNLYSRIYDYVKAEEYYLKALESYTLLFNQDPDVYHDGLARLKSNMGVFYTDIHNYTKAEDYYLQALKSFGQLFNQNPDVYRICLSKTSVCLGNLYVTTHDYSKAEEYYLKAQENCIPLFNQNPVAHREDFAGILHGLGRVYHDKHNYVKSEEYYLKALENYTILFHQNPDVYLEDFANIQNNLGGHYSDLHNYTKAEEHYLKALENFTLLFSMNPDIYCADLAKIQYNLGLLYKNLKDYNKAEIYYLKALENRTMLLSKNPSIYYADVADTQNNLGNLYMAIRNYSKAEKYYLQSLENYSILFVQNPNVYRTVFSLIQYNLGYMYFCMKDNSRSEQFFNTALENYTILFNESSDKYRARLAWTQLGLMFIYEERNDMLDIYESMLNDALANFEVLFIQDESCKDIVIELRNRKGYRLLSKGNTDDALTLFKNAYLLNPNVSAPYLATGCNAKAYEYAKAGDYAKAIESIDRAISLMPEEANLYDSKGEILLMKGDEQEAVKMWRKVLELEPEFLSKHHGETELHRQLKEKRLIE